MNIIEFKNVSKAFGRKSILQGMDLSIQKGETITIIGGSGTGKSVTLKLILGLLYPDKGEILFKGENVVEMEEDALVKMRSQVGMLFQGAALFDSLTVFDNVAYPLREHYHHPEEKLREIVAEKLKLVGLPGIEDMYPSDLSGGMKKRVGLARAIATEPEVLLYDEPTTGLDPSNTNRIGELIIQIQNVLKVTSVVVTHDMASAFKISDRMALLYEKKIKFVGTVDEMRNSPDDIVQKFIHGEMEGS